MGACITVHIVEKQQRFVEQASCLVLCAKLVNFEYISNVGGSLKIEEIAENRDWKEGDS